MNVKSFLLTCTAALSLLFSACDNQIGKKPAPPQGTRSAKPQPPKPAAQQAQKPAQRPSMMDDVNGVIDYGTGATAVRAKKKMEDKLGKAQDQHNRQLDEALK